MTAVSRGAFRPGPRGTQSSVETSAANYPLSAPLNASYSWVANGSICTVGDVQYAVWVDDNRKVRIARRAWQQGWSSAVDLSAASGTVFGAAVTEDSHNTIRVAVDQLGYIHICGDQHAVALKYMRSSLPHTITGSWTGSMVGTQETSVTYPQFFTSKAGAFFFFYRDGTSGDANWLLNKWNPTALTWSRVTQIFQGATDNNSAYPQDFAVDPSSGRWHMIWTVRDNMGGASVPANNANLFAAYSDDEGVTWKKYSDGSSYTLPITKASGEVIQTIAGGADTTLLNGHHARTVLDGSGYPHTLFLVADTGLVWRYRHVWWDGAAWHYDTLLSDTNAGSRRADLVRFADGDFRMIFQTSSPGGTRLNYLRAYNLTTTTETVMRATDMLLYEPVMEYVPSRDVLYVMAPYERTDGLTGGEPADIAAQASVPFYAFRGVDLP